MNGKYDRTDFCWYTASIRKISNMTFVADLIGAIDSQREPDRDYEKTLFGEAIASKLAKQR